ncbi:MAG: type II toxin-antitoxin system RelE/ParE family toxin [Candidatus Nanoarchaeia archaeon]|nr:type II toxin-antitoxin system RelE/ParE family toxin [Candidatus Nanoarchaeia archaeon]
MVNFHHYLNYKMKEKYEVIISENFKKKFYKLSKPLQERVRKILDKLKYILCGEALKGDLQTFYSVHFENNKYRLIYQKEDHVIRILVLHVGRRKDDFYNKLKQELGLKN